MTDIRLLEHYEVPILLPGARSFFAEGQIAGKLNDVHFVSSLSGNISSGSGFVMVAGSPPRGAIAGILCKDFATGEQQCVEYFWYVHQHERGSLGIRLLDAFEKEAFSRGAKIILMMHHVAHDKDKFEKVYTNRGYRLHEQVFMKEGR